MAFRLTCLMSGNGPRYTKRHGIAWLIAAVVIYFLISSSGVSARNLIMGWIFVGISTVIGIYVLFIDVDKAP